MVVQVKKKSVAAYPDHFRVSPPDTAIVITLAASRVRGRMEGIIVWSYSAAPTNGRLTMAGAGFNLDIDITAAGPDYIPFPCPIHAADDTDVILTLAAGGAGVVGKLNIFGLSRGK